MNNRLLVVDDDPDFRLLLNRFLTRAGYVVTEAEDGEGALAMVAEQRPALLLLDVEMPGGPDGFEVCRRLRRRVEGRQLPVIMVTGHNDDRSVDAAYSAGADEFISKPIHWVVLRNRVHYLIQARQAEEELKHERDFVTTVLDTADSLVMVLDTEGRIVRINRACREVGGIRPEELVGVRAWECMFPPEEVPGVEHYFRDFLAGRASGRMETQWQSRGKGMRYVAWSNTVLRDAGGAVEYVVATGTDLTERRFAEQELQRTRQYLRNVIDSMPSVMISVDDEGQVTLWNHAAEEATGVAAERARGEPLERIYPLLAGQMEAVLRSLRERRPRKTERFKSQVGSEVRYHDVMVYPLLANGAVGAVIRVDDVTARVRIEDMMVQTEKMMSVGGLAAGMAHEINNPLGGILQAAQNVLRRISPDLPKNRAVAAECGTELEKIACYLERREIVKFIDGMREAGDRAARIVANMLQFSRPAAPRRVPVALDEVLERTVELAASDYDLKKRYDFRKIEIVKEFDPALPAVPCVATEIEQVLLNLLKNAAQAMASQPEGGRPPRITLRTARDGAMARIEVEDNGPGMDEEVRRRVFEPFFTTKAVGIGTGLGLSVSYFIITNNHRGALAVESAPGEGARFVIGLPLEGGE